MIWLAFVISLAISVQCFGGGFDGIENRGRGLKHLPLIKNVPLYGNVTELQYFYATIYVGSQKHRQFVIVDTGSSEAALPCKELCNATSCGTHANGHFAVTNSTTHKFSTCSSPGCQCEWRKNRCSYYTRYMEGSSYEGYLVKD